jgi:hypothetical protein
MKMWRVFLVGMVCWLIPIIGLLYTALEVNKVYPAWMWFLGGLSCLLLTFLGSLSFTLFGIQASEKPDESIAAIRRLEITSFLGFMSVVAAFAITVLAGVLLRIDVSFLGAIRLQTVCSTMQGSLRSRPRLRVVQLQEPRK